MLNTDNWWILVKLILNKGSKQSWCLLRSRLSLQQLLLCQQFGSCFMRAQALLENTGVFLDDWMRRCFGSGARECFSLKRNIAVDNNRLSFVSVSFYFLFLKFLSISLYSTMISDKAWGRYGGDSYNSSVDSFPPEEEVEQDLACLLPRKPKVKWLYGEVLNNDQWPRAVWDAKQAISSCY